MSRSNSGTRWRRQLLERAARRCGHLFGLGWIGNANALVASRHIRMTGQVRFDSSGLWCRFELTIPAHPGVGAPHAAACLRLPLSPAQGADPAWISRAVKVLNSRAAGVPPLPHMANGYIALRSQVVLGSSADIEKPSTELQRALTDTIASMAVKLLSVGENWWMICANLDHERQRQRRSPLAAGARPGAWPVLSGATGRSACFPRTRERSRPEQ